MDRGDDRQRRAARPVLRAPADRRQALHRRRRRQDHAAAHPAGRGLRRRRAAALRPRPRAHRRHARQARVDPGLAGDAVATRSSSPSSRDVGAVICAAGEGLAPADRKLYALRDVTGTVEAIPLIASSIMSKKIAEGTGRAGPGRQGRHRRVHEVRSTTPASWPARWSSWAGAHGVTYRRAADRHVHAARAARSATPSRSRSRVEVLAGGGPADVVELTLALAREMLDAAGLPDADPAEALAGGRGDGLVARDDPRPGRRSGRGAARWPARPRCVTRRGRRRTSSPSTRTPSGSPPGGSAPAGPARRIRSAPAPA